MSQQRAILIALLLAPLAALGATGLAKPPGRPSVLLIVADDLGYGDVGVHGCKDFATPHLDSIARDGMRFTSGYVPAPVCGPSRAGLLTGRHPCRILPFHGNPPPGSDAGLPLEHRTIADRLKAAGYRTAALGKWHLGESAAHHPMSRGFDEFFGFLSGMHSYVNAEDPKWGPLLRGRGKAELRDYLTFALADEACAIVRRPSPDPFFLYLAFNAPHIPMEAPEAYLAKTAHIADPMRRTNAAMVVALDDAVGRVMTALRESGREADTLVVFLSDNGAALIPGSAPNGGSNAPLRGSKAQLWEGGIRVPFFVRWPGHVAAGGTSDAPVSALDLMPTLLAAAGVPAPMDAVLDGVDLLPWLEGRAKAPDRGRLFWKFGASQFAIRDGDMKLVRVNDDRGLFNVRTDIAEASGRAGKRPVLDRQLDTAWKEWDAANPVPSPKTTPAARPDAGVTPAPPPAAPAPRDASRQTGAIDIVNDGGAWWFATPGGARFLSIGMNHVEPVYWQSPNNTQFVGETYGPDLFRPGGEFNDGSAAAAKWAGRAAANLKSWGFNTLGMHNPPLASLRSADVACYVVELDLHVPWGWNMKRAELVRAFARRPMDVFADAFVADARSTAARCVKPVAGDPRVLGYAYSDGPPWTIDDDAPGGGKLHPWVLAIMALPAEAPGKQAWLAMIKERYPSAAAAGAVYGRASATWEDLASATAWDPVTDMPAALVDSRAFLERLIRRWYGVLRDAIREHDPHHLILGDKLNANRDARHPADRAWSLGVVKDYADVIFVQYYAPIEEQRVTLVAIHEATRKPVLIGDSACRPLWKDCALDDAGYYGEMGRVYADHVTGLFSLPYVVGWHHCGYMRGLRRPYVEALKRGDRAAIEEHVKRKMTLREGFISEQEEPIALILNPLGEAISACEAIHRRRP